MNNPVCTFCGFEKNPPDAKFCTACLQVIVHPVMQNFLKAVNQKRQEEARPRPSLIQALWRSIARHSTVLLWLLGIPTGIAVVAGVGYFFTDYTAPLSRLNRQGSPLSYASPAGVLSYLASIEGEVKTWSERDGRIDTAISDEGIHETGTLRLEKTPGSGMELPLLVHAQEWIKNQDTAEQTGMISIPSNHPSLAPGQIIVDSEGTVVARQNMTSTRVGRCLPFLMPRWPKGIHRRGDQWAEPIEWWDMLGPWKIHWKALLHWQIDGFAPCGDSSCAEISYHGQLQPEVLAFPGWAKGALAAPQFSGEAQGDVRFNVSDSQLVSNLFNYEGNFLFPLSDLSRIPIELRIGREVEAEPGTLVLHVKEKIDIRKP